MVISKRFFPMFALSFLSCHSADAMEQPQKECFQLRLKDPEDATIITYYAMITEGKLSPAYDDSIKYATQSVHAKLQLPTTIKDPLMTFKVVENLNYPLTIKLKKVIPLKHTFNLNDGSLLATIKRDGAQLYPNNPSLKDKQFLIKIVCAKNPKLNGNSFAQQRYIAKKEFYKEPNTWADEKDSIQELIDAEIIKKIKTELIISQTGNEAWEQKKIDVFGHGPKGISNDEVLRQSLLKEKIPHNKSCFKTLRNRELTGSFRR